MFVTHPICWVSRQSVLTGLYGRSLGSPNRPDSVRPEIAETLHSDILRAAGYRTGFFGKWHALMPAGYRPEDHFDEFEAIGRDPYYKPMPDGSLRHETEIIADRGIAFVRNQPKDKPFTLYLWFNACHAEDNDRRPGIGHFPWPRAADGLHVDAEICPPSLDDPAIFDALPLFLRTTIARERYFWRWNTPEKYKTNIRAYFRMVSGIDSAIARVVTALDEAGIADNTIIVYSADNGLHMGNRGLAGKWSHFEESLRVPLIVYDPRLPEPQRGRATEAIALNIDLPATFLDWAGAQVPDSYQGESLRPLIEGEQPAEWRTETFHEHFAVRNRIPAFEGLRGSKFKYVRYVDHGYEFLHDLENDPDELVNLAANREYVHVLESLRERTSERVAELGGPLPPRTAAFTASTVPHPPASAAVTVKPGRDGWVNLLPNQSGLRDWAGDLRYWSLNDGILTGVTHGSLHRNRSLTWKGSTIRNFDLRVRVRINKSGSSALRYRGRLVPERALDVVTGYAYQVVADHSSTNGILDEQAMRHDTSRSGDAVNIDDVGTSPVTGAMAAKGDAAAGWHEYRILVRGNHHQFWIDGQQTGDFIDDDAVGSSHEGILGVELHAGASTTVEYRDFRIKHLPDDLGSVVPAQAEKRGRGQVQCRAL
jgi:choline-sulfatase